MDDTDIFINYSVYPKADNLFQLTVPPIDSIKDSCVFVMDTNVLLLPYTTSPQSIQEIKNVYEKLIGENRLIIPGQVVREFAKNRPEKIKDVFQQLSDKKSRLPKLDLGKYPLLDALTCYGQAAETENQINKLIDVYRKQIGQIIEAVQSWTWNDPVSSIYKDLFTSEVIFELEFNREEIKKDLIKRYTHQIPPGFKDKGKPDAGIGDLLIWHTILEIGKEQKQDVVFVSMEEKSDWFHRSGNHGLYPRFELVNEFSLCSERKSFHIINLSKMLKLFKADETIIEEIRNAEETAKSVLQILKKTITEKIPIQFNYIRPGKTPGIRIGNPHAVFIKRLKSGEEQIYVHVWQTGGVTDSGQELPGWRQFFLDDVTDVVPLPDGSPFAIAEGYNPESYE